MVSQIIDFHETVCDLHVGTAIFRKEIIQTGEEIFQLMSDSRPSAIFPIRSELLEEVERRFKDF